jgi:hypothetical protein
MSKKVELSIRPYNGRLFVVTTRNAYIAAHSLSGTGLRRKNESQLNS